VLPGAPQVTVPALPATPMAEPAEAGRRPAATQADRVIAALRRWFAFPRPAVWSGVALACITVVALLLPPGDAACSGGMLGSVGGSHARGSGLAVGGLRSWTV